VVHLYYCLEAEIEENCPRDNSSCRILRSQSFSFIYNRVRLSTPSWL